MDLWSLLEDRTRAMPHKVLLRWQDTQLTYSEVRQRALQTAGALHSLGIRSGDHVCLMLGNSADYVTVWLGLCRLGAVAVPINVHTRGAGLAYILEHSGAPLLVVEANLLPRVEEVAPLLTTRPALVTRGASEGECSPELAALVAGEHGSPPAGAVAPESVASILYTSGTTGPPKGVMLSHLAYVSSARYFAEEMVHATADDVLYTSLPLFHINAQAHTVLPAILLGATCALGERFSASGFWSEIRRHRATLFNSLAAMIPILCKQPPDDQDRAHGARLTACAATPKDAWRTFEERFGVQIVEGYGLTETAGFCVANPLSAARVGSIGRPLGFVEARVAGPADRPLPAGETGEIQVRASGAHLLMEGYFKMPEQTAEAMRGGWFHTGDAGQADVDGYLYFVDRMKQSIRRRGENISSWEVEQVVNAHPAVLESAAVGVPSELGEEDVKVYVVLRPGQTLDPADLLRWCEPRMAYFMVPRYVEARESLPKTATERVEKYKLKQEGIGAAWDRERAGYRLRRS